MKPRSQSADMGREDASKAAERRTRNRMELLRGAVSAMDAGCFRLLGMGLGLVVVAAGLSFQLPLLLASVMYHPDSDSALLNLGLVFSGQYILSTAARLLHERAAQELAYALRRRLFGRLLNQPVSFFDASSYGVLHNALWEDIDAVQSGIGHELALLEGRIAAMVASLVGLFTVSPAFASLIVFAVPVVAVALSSLGERLIYPLQQAIHEASSSALQVADESLAQIRVVKAFAIEDFVTKRLDGPLRRKMDAEMSSARRAQSFEAFIYVAVAFLLGVGIYIGRLFVSPELLMAILGYAANFGLALANMSRGLVVLDNSLTCLGRSLDLLSRPLETGLLPLKDSAPLISVDELVMTNLTFTYPGATGKALDSINLVFRKGEATAIVGDSGSGKSTLLNLLLRFYAPDRLESILVDGCPLGSIPLAEWRRITGYVPRDPCLFSGSIYDNIAAVGASKEMIIEACRIAQVLDFVHKLPGKFDYQLGANSALLSSGQLQRISVARALVRRPKVLLLDEHTAALDNITEQSLMLALDPVIGDCLTIMVCHRLSTAQRCARVVVMASNGRVMEQGSPEELMRISNGHFVRLQRAHE